MPPPSPSQAQFAQQDPDTLSRVGGWLFKRRTSLPLPIAVALLVVPHASAGPPTWPGWPLLGLAVVAVGELIRAWGVRHIGAISRTRADRLGPLVDSGPFGYVRNPLYIGNILLWLGLTLSARLPGLAPLVVGLLAIEYHAIVRWEERLLDSRIGERYRHYIERVPRWIPRLSPSSSTPVAATPFTWRQTLYSERGTLIAIAAGYLLLALKARVT